MDVTFTNVLEGARQYFQGLPAATGSAASPSSSTVSYGAAVPASHSDSGPIHSAAVAVTVNSHSQPQASHQSSNNNSHGRPNNEASVQYWSVPPQHSQEQERNKEQLHENVMHHPQYRESLPSLASQPQTIKQPVQHSYHYQQGQIPASQSYQFSRPQSHEAASNVLQYASHYSSTTHRPLNTQAGSHHHQSLQHLPPNQSNQTRSPSRPHEQMSSSSKTQSYHQLQPPRHHTPTSIYMNNYQQPKPYYPSHSQPQTSLPPSSSYSQPASSQAYMPNHQFTPHSYSPHSHTPVTQTQSQTQYLSTKTSQHYDNVNGSKMEPQSVTSQHHRTHNLPPIAALSSVNYHSNKNNRETVQRLTNHKHRTQTSVAVSMNSAPTTVSASTSQQQSSHLTAQYSQSSNQYNNANSYTHTTNSASGSSHNNSTNSSTYPYPPASSSQAYTCTTTTTSSTSSSLSTSSTATIYNQSSYPQHFQKLPKAVYQESNQKQTQYQSSSSKDYHYQAAPPMTSSRMNVEQIPANNVNQHIINSRTENHVTPGIVMTAKQKRESPLDLSVKTVRTSADSTAHDESEIHSSEAQRSNKSYTSNRSMPPPIQVPSNGSYMTYDHHATNHQRNANVRPSSASSGGAPKVDFLPNFNVPTLHHSQRNHSVDNRQVIQQPQSDKNVNPNHVSDPNRRNLQYNTKVSYPQQASYHSAASYSHSYNSNVMPNSVHPNPYGTSQLPVKRPTESLPRIDFPPSAHHIKGPTPSAYPNTSNVVREPHRKRPTEMTSPVPNKIPKMDSWRQTIDQQIEQRLSSARKHLEQQSPILQAQQQPPTHSSSIQQPQIQQKALPPVTPKQLINGNVAPNYQRPRDAYVNPYSQSNSSSYPQAQQPFTNNNSHQYHSQSTAHSQTYVPTAMGQHHYPSYPPNITNHSQQPPDIYQQNILQRTNSNPKLVPTSPVKNNNYGGADKRVLSILRNSLEIKGANKEAQKKMEQGQMKPQEIHANHMRSSGVQQPSTDVTAPLQPKHGIVGRQNVSPFPATNMLERNSNTPPIYKFHFPRAVDSVRFESETITKDNNPIQTVEKFIEKQEMYTADNNTIIQNQSNAPPTGASSGANDLDGLAAFLAARIRTKAELKQVGINQNQIPPTVPCSSEKLNSNVPTISEKNTTQVTNNANNSVSPPKLIIERAVIPPRRRLFSRSEEESNANASSGSNPPNRDSVLRSSSETSVFDFRDSDSEGEMPVLERLSLDDMRKDRKSLNKTQQPATSLVTDVEIKIEEPEIEIKQEEEEKDPFWDDTCYKFLEQLKITGTKRRGRRKKIVEPDVLAKLETATKEKPLENINLEVVVKLENIVLPEPKDSSLSEVQIKVEDKPKSPKIEDDSDSDVPLSKRKDIVIKTENPGSDGEDSNLETKREKIGAKIKIEYTSDSSDSESETIQSVSEKLRSKKLKESKENNTPNKLNENEKGMVLRSADSSPAKKIDPAMKKKAIFGDGSDFHPGWEEEVYKYKRSLRMPARLISITRPPHWHRMSTSLPDLDPCSPAASSLTDDTEFSMNHRRLPSSNSFTETSHTKSKRDILDSDIDSNSSFTFSLQKGFYDSEEASCSSVKLPTNRKFIKGKENNNSILDVLVERYSKYKRKKAKGKDPKVGPKIIPKATSPLELLPTPSLGIGSPEKVPNKPGRGRTKLNKDKDKDKEENKVEINDSVYLGFFRKQTVNNFRDTFKKNSGFMRMGEPFSTVVLKSRTRTETRVMKQRATIREVFGEERPASAPPIACREDDTSQDSVVSDKKPEIYEKVVKIEKSEKEKDKKSTMPATKKYKENIISPIRAGLRSASGRKSKILITKKLQRGRKRGTTLLKTLAVKKARTDSPDDQNTIKSETLIKSETPPVEGEEKVNEGTEANKVPTKKRLKLRNMRRKFSSGFDYIRKKKKQVKKESVDTDGTGKSKRGKPEKPSPESVQDIAKEIKTWVMNKGIGETHLHRAARLGYTDVIAYCLEKLDYNPSPKDNAGYTPLHEACQRGHLEIAILLLQYGANPIDSAQGGIRPLHEAAENGYVEIVRLLLSYGADPLLATYSGQTPLSLATDEITRMLLKQYMADMQGLPGPHWTFKGPAKCFDPIETGYDPLADAPNPDPLPEDEDIEIEMSDQQLPNLYTLRGEPPNDRWVLLQDLSVILKIKSRDTLLRQINSNTASTSTSTSSHKSILKELKFADFMEQAHCCQLLCANEKLNARSSKVALVKYTDKVKQLLGVERVVVTAR